MAEELPKKLMKDVYWAFGGKISDDYAEFSEQVRDYHVRIMEKDSWRPDTEVFPFPAIRVRYEYWTADGDELEDVIELEADNGKSFTAGELLFKLDRAVSENLKNGDHIFFEGLTLADRSETDSRRESAPFYWMYTGS